MISIYTGLALVTAGIAALSGILHLISGLSKDGEKADILFGLLSLSAFIFLILPPQGFILSDEAPYPVSIEIKRIFIWLYYGLLPWFFEAYSGKRMRAITYTIELCLVVAYVSMLFELHDRTQWFYISRLALALIFYNGIVAAYSQIRTNRISEGRWLISAMMIYGVLLLLSTINQVSGNFLGNLLNAKSFFPLHLNLVAFIVIMSIRLQASTRGKYQLEKALHWRDMRWNTLVQNMHLVIIELDTAGSIRYINPYAVKKLGFDLENQLLGKNWFDEFALANEKEYLKANYRESLKEEKMLSQFTTSLRGRGNEQLQINWTNVFSYDADDLVIGMMGIGMDNTEQLKAFVEVQKLKEELEKENLALKGEKFEDQFEEDIVGQSDALLYAIQKSKQVAGTNAGVLLLGETGSGKELFATLIQKKSYRADKPFIKVNCAALPSELIESELFGHEKGSFTGAVSTRKGKFELADGGTIFLDEIGELPITLQSKLLRVLQSGELERIGSQNVIKVDVRIIAATNRNLQWEVKSGHFREDLFYRLNVFPITIPSLRKRKGDIPLLVRHYVKFYSEQHGKTITEISKAEMTRLTEYSWPGNIRELRNLIERSIIISSPPTLRCDWQNDAEIISEDHEENDLILDVEKAHILKILQDCHGKINGADGAAIRLGLHPSTLRSKMKKLNIERREII